MKKYKKAVFVKIGAVKDKVYLCGIPSIKAADREIMEILDRDMDLYGCKCSVKTRNGIKKGWIVSNILVMSETKMKILAENLGGYYPLAKVVSVDYEVNDTDVSKLLMAAFEHEIHKA